MSSLRGLMSCSVSDGMSGASYTQEDGIMNYEYHW